MTAYIPPSHMAEWDFYTHHQTIVLISFTI
nr:MAG TPA: hypothetical protein [Caudoviricetes sp.]